jgi:hypothetical protein
MQYAEKYLVAQPLCILPATIKPSCTTMQCPNGFVEAGASPLPAVEADVFI